jgi:hypothetical protein
MIRGEVIVNFTKDTYVQGPIELLFEGIQRFYPWPGNVIFFFFQVTTYTTL